jgi:MFS family permease
LKELENGSAATDFDSGPGIHGWLWVIRNAYLFAVCNACADLVASRSILVLCALKLGAPDFLIGILIALSGLAVLFQPLAIESMARKGRKAVMLLFQRLVVFTLILLSLCPNVRPVTLRLPLLLLLVLLYNAVLQMGSAGWFPLLQDLVPKEYRGRFFGGMRSCWQFATVLFLIFSGLFLPHDLTLTHFTALFLVGASLQTFAILFLERLPDERQKDSRKQFPAEVAEAWRDRRFRSFLIFSFLTGFCLLLPDPYFVAQMQLDLNYGPSFILFCSALASMGAFVSLYPWGLLADHFGNHWIYALGISCLMLLLAPWLLIRVGQSFQLWLLPALFFSRGIFTAGIGIALVTQLYGLLKKGETPTRIVLYNVFYGIGSGFGTTFAGALVSFLSRMYFPLPLSMSRYHWIFAMNILLFGCLFLLVRKVAHPSDVSPGELLGRVYRTGFVRPTEK